MGIGFLIGVWLVRYLGSEQFGLYSFATAFVGMFGALAGLGLQNIVVREIVRNPACKEEVLGTAAVLQLAAGFLAYVFLICGIFWLRHEDTLAKLLVAILGSMMLFKFSDIALYWFESQILSKYIVWIQNTCFLMFAVIKLSLIIINAPLLAFVWATAIEPILAGVLILFMLSLRGLKLQELHFSKNQAKKLLVDSWPMLLSSVAIMIYMKIDQIMLGQMLGNHAVGIYSAALRISEVWYFIPMMIGVSVSPIILKTKEHDDTKYQQRMQRLFDLMVLIAIVIALPMTFLSTHIMVGLFGAEYTESGLILAIHIWTSIFVFLGVASNQWFIAENLQVLNFQRAALGLLINILLNFLMIPKYGVVGAAIATLLAQVCATLLFDLIQPKTRKIFLMKVKAFNLVRTLIDITKVIKNEYHH
jgi:PST family polysaccharide transporter